MADITRVEKNGHIGHIVQVRPGEKLMLCRCYKSATFPLCDLVHGQYQETFGPLIIQGVNGDDTQKSS